MSRLAVEVAADNWSASLADHVSALFGTAPFRDTLRRSAREAAQGYRAKRPPWAQS